jgi:hypothetical protein
MISGILFSLLLMSSGIDEGLSLDDLLAHLDIDATAEVGFSESRQSELLVDDLEVTGVLRQDSEGRLIREVHTPGKETQVLTSSRVEISRPDGSQRRFRLSRAPELAVLYQALSAILARDAKVLSEHFEGEVEGDSKQWQLILTPRAEDLARQVERMTVSGREGRIECFVLHLGDGEEIRTRIHDLP